MKRWSRIFGYGAFFGMGGVIGSFQGDTLSWVVSTAILVCAAVICDRRAR